MNSTDKEAAVGVSATPDPKTVSKIEPKAESANQLTVSDIESSHPGESSESQDDPSKSIRAWLVVLAAFLGFAGDYGYFNSIGAVQSYLNLHQLRDTPTTQSSFIFSCFLLLSYAMCIVGGVLYDVLGPRIPMIIGACFVFCGTFCTGNCKTVGQFVAVFGILNGIGLGIFAGPLAGIVNCWFAKSKYASTAFAITTVGASVGGIVFPLLLNRLYIVSGFTWALRVFSFVQAGLLGICIALAVDTPEAKEEKKNNRIKSLAQIYSLFAKMIDFRSMLEPPFLLCSMAVGFADLGLTLTLTYFPSYITFRGYSETRANTCVTIMNALGIVGRYLPGPVADRIGPFNVMIVMITCSCLSIWFLWVAWSLSAVGMASIYMFCVIYGFFNSSVLSLAPTCIASLGLKETFGQRYGTVSLLAGVIMFGGVVGGGTMINHESIFHFRTFAILCASLYTGSIGCYLCCRYLMVGRKLKVRV